MVTTDLVWVIIMTTFSVHRLFCFLFESRSTLCISVCTIFNCVFLRVNCDKIMHAR